MLSMDSDRTLACAPEVPKPQYEPVPKEIPLSLGPCRTTHVGEFIGVIGSENSSLDSVDE